MGRNLAAIDAPHDLGRLRRADLIIVPGWRGARSPVPEPLLKALRQAHKRGARIATLCSGVFVPARAGLLDGRRATTHWRYADTLRAEIPAIEVVPDILYAEDGNILTAAGSAAGIDLCLHIVRSDFGREIANQVARRLVLPAHREGGQQQFIRKPVARQRQDQIGTLFDTLRARLNEAGKRRVHLYQADARREPYLGTDPQGSVPRERRAAGGR